MHKTNCYPLTHHTWKCHRTIPCKMSNFFISQKICCVPPRSAEIQLTSQQDASATRPYPGLVFDTRAFAVSKLGYTNVIFVEPEAKLNGQYYRDVLLTPTSAPQHCWRHVCLLARQCTSTSCSWHSRASVLWDTAVHQSWHVASQQTWPQPGR